MGITSAKFLRGVTGPDDMLEDGTPQVAFIGRSNVGKSSIINSLTGEKGLARTSRFPGLTREINIYWINNALYLIDLPGYGFAKASREGRARLQELIAWYLFHAGYTQKKVVLIVDGKVGATESDLELLHALEAADKNILIVVNKVDKIKKSGFASQLQKIRESVGDHKIIPYSTETKVGISDLISEILN